MMMPLTKLPHNILPLIDGDWILHMACSAIEYRLMKEWEEKCIVAEDVGEDYPPEPTPSFHDTIEVLENRIKEIKNALQTTTAPILFFTGENNFRKELSKTKVYKGTRKQEKPFHYKNLKNYVEVNYATVEENNLEADDLMAIWQTDWEINKPLDSDKSCCIVTVDKDLRQVNGWHYSPEGHNYGSFGPKYCTDDNTYIEPKDPTNVKKGLVGTGYKFFYSQLITGDSVDNIPGLPGSGAVAALSLIDPCGSEGECYEVVRDAYRDKCLMADDYLLEQARLLWMIRGYDDGEILHWNPPVVRESKIEIVVKETLEDMEKAIADC